MKNSKILVILRWIFLPLSYWQVDLLVKKDPSGNNFVDSNLIKQKTNLTEEQVKSVQKAMTTFNQLPNELKDGSNQAVQQISNTATIKQLQKDENTQVEKLLSFVSEFGNVKASAWWCSPGTDYSVYYWWGQADYLNPCGVSLAKAGYGLIALGSSRFGTLVSIWAGTLAVLVDSNNWCGNGVIIYRAYMFVSYYGFWASPRC
jgi:hypothetical protein